MRVSFAACIDWQMFAAELSARSATRAAPDAPAAKYAADLRTRL
ncbi:MAG: hypothetical protein OXF27_00575 [Acidobacteria bacterium]|nr:hypothetical protein [Acidobacteriota bacterium]